MKTVNFWVEDANGNIVIDDNEVGDFAVDHDLTEAEAVEKMIELMISTGKLPSDEKLHVMDDF
mgnify:FL=1